MAFQILKYHDSDLPSLYRICLKTGDHGKDASQLYKDPDLLGHYYVAPYAVSEPDMCFLLDLDGLRCGYILGTKDTRVFNAWCEENWFPHLRTRYRLSEIGEDGPDSEMIQLFHRKKTLRDVTVHYPAHLHIDLLPVAQGQGWGHKMMRTFLDNLVLLNIRGVHLGVSKNNPRAIRFYEREGFVPLQESTGGITYGMQF